MPHFGHCAVLARNHVGEMRQCRMHWLFVLTVLGAIGCSRIPDPVAPLSAEEVSVQIERAPRSARKANELAEAFALNSRATEVQRDMLTADVVGHAVTWDVTVYDIESSEGRLKLTSQVIPVTDNDALPMLRVQAMFLPANSADLTRIRSLRTGDPVRIRGVVKEIWLRTLVVLAPAALEHGG
jgi:hypothetical protein